MDKPIINSEGFFKKECLFEAALVLVALLLGWLADINPFADLKFAEPDIFFAVLATLPLYLLFLILERVRFESVSNIRKLLFDTLAANLHNYHWTDLFMLAAIAGLSEELLFRGVIQPWLENLWGLSAGLLVSNLIFGLVHAVTPIYALLAALVGIYLGVSLDFMGERNLLIPIIIHGLYDFLAFIALMRAYRASRVE
ncbi:MAG: CPBP family intramembrane glutamic endopeptidase [Methylococcales bacterium]